MRYVVADASVVVKWFVQEDEPDAAAALALFGAVREGAVHLVQPVHWIAEVAAVVARLRPRTAEADAHALCALSVTTAQQSFVYERATRLAVDLDHHLFDTLYHAVTLETPGAVLVTADDRYARKAAHLGPLVPLADDAEAE